MMHKGGLETRLFNYMNYFLERGDQVCIITSKILDDIQLPPGVQVVKHDLSRYPRQFRHLLFSNWLYTYLKQQDFDYSLSLERTWGQQRLIAPSTHIGYLKGQKKWWRSPSDWIQLYMDNKAFKLTKQIYACSQMVKDEMVQYCHVAADKVIVLFPPLNTKVFHLEVRNNRTAYQKKFNIDATKTNFLFVSTSHKRKGLDLLLDLFSKDEMKDKHLYVAGSAFRSTTPNVHHVGFVKEPHELYAAVDCTLHPSIYEPFGQIVSESLACGTFVMVSDHVGAKEIVSKNIGKVIESGNKKAWFDQLLGFQKTSLKEDEIKALAFSLSMEEHMKILLK